MSWCHGCRARLLRAKYSKGWGLKAPFQSLHSFLIAAADGTILDIRHGRERTHRRFKCNHRRFRNLCTTYFSSTEILPYLRNVAQHHVLAPSFVYPRFTLWKLRVNIFGGPGKAAIFAHCQRGEVGRNTERASVQTVPSEILQASANVPSEICKLQYVSTSSLTL